MEKVIVAIHGWQGDRNSMQPIMKLMKIYNAGWYLLEAPYTLNGGNGRSWSYQLSDGVWEVEEPKGLLRSFFTEIFEIEIKTQSNFALRDFFKNTPEKC